jgi:hypothetical protein
MVEVFKAERKEVIGWLKDMIKMDNSFLTVFQISKELSP